MEGWPVSQFAFVIGAWIGFAIEKRIPVVRFRLAARCPTAHGTERCGTSGRIKSDGFFLHRTSAWQNRWHRPGWLQVPKTLSRLIGLKKVVSVITERCYWLIGSAKASCEKHDGLMLLARFLATPDQLNRRADGASLHWLRLRSRLHLSNMALERPTTDANFSLVHSMARRAIEWLVLFNIIIIIFRTLYSAEGSIISPINNTSYSAFPTSYLNYHFYGSYLRTKVVLRFFHNSFSYFMIFG